MIGNLLPLSPEFYLLIPLAVAAGIDLYLTLLVGGLYLFLGDTILGSPPPLPSGASPVLLGLGVLYLVELGAQGRPMPALLWHGLQLLLRPLGGALLGLTLLAGSSSGVMLLGVMAAALVTAFTHVLYWGQELYLRLVPKRHVSPLTFALAADTFALLLSVLAWEAPEIGLPVAVTLLIGGVLFGGPLHGVVRFGTILLRDLTWGHVAPNDWVSAQELPAWVRRWGDTRLVERLRGQRAGARRLPGHGTFKEGWLMEVGQDAQFIFRSGWRRTSAVALGDAEWGCGETNPLALRVPLRWPTGASAALFLQKSGPGTKTHK